MTNTMFIIGIAGLLLIIALILNKPFRKQLLIKYRGRTDEIMSKDAMTPEGAADIFNNAIREKEDKYIKANQLYTEVTGKLETARKNLRQMQKEQMQKTQQCQNAVDNNNDQDAMVIAMRLETLKSNIEVLKQTITELEASVDHQKEVRDQLALEVTSLKEEKDMKILALKEYNQTIALHETIDEVVSSNESDRMLEKVRDGVTKAQEKATGSRMAYESSVSTQERRVAQRAKEESARKIVESMKRKG